MDSVQPLLSATELAKILCLSKRQVFRLNNSGRIPAPIHIGHSVRWSANEINNWIAAGAPDRKKWAAMKGGAK